MCLPPKIGKPKEHSCQQKSDLSPQFEAILHSSKTKTIKSSFVKATYESYGPFSLVVLEPSNVHTVRVLSETKYT